MYKLRADVTIDDISDEMGVVAIQEITSLLDPRFPKGRLGGRDLFDEVTMPGPNPEKYDRWRITVGAPDLSRDAQPEEVFALEALLEELNGVDFQKGCFVGQENVSRMKRRGTTRRKFCPVVFDGEPPTYGTPVRAGEAELGSIRTGVSGRAISLLRLDRALAAMEKGQQLTAGDKSVRLDPPDWLLLPARDD